ncbi:MAG: hypothetical protein AAGC67_00430 [Myxococcota bacterium]
MSGLRPTLARAGVVCVLTALVAGACVLDAVRIVAIDVPAPSPAAARGDLLGAERVARYPVLAYRLVTALATPRYARLREFEAIESGATLYRLRYRTPGVDGRLVVASGLVAIPHRRPFRSTIVYHHGTSANRENVPSYPLSRRSFLLSSTIAGTRSLLIAPDYVGLGGSEDRHPYLHAVTEASASIDLIRASDALLESLSIDRPDPLFLMGYSQGGYSTLAAHRALEGLARDEMKVEASVSISGPTDLRGISLAQALTGTAPSHAFYLAYTASAYAMAYDRPLETLLAEEYAERIWDVFDGHHATSEIVAALPEDPRRLFRADFLEAYAAGGAHWFTDALAANSVLDWTPEAPIRFLFGNDDVDVSRAEARAGAGALRARGAEAEAVSLGDLDHGKMMLSGIAQALRWLREREAPR